MTNLYTPANALAIPIVQGITDGRLDDPTPCAEYRVRDLTNHLFHVVMEFQKAARHEEMDFSSTPDYLEDGWRERFADEAHRLDRAWARPEALEGGTNAMGFPRETVAMMPVFDLMIHGWDLARATGQDYEPDAALADAVHEMARGIAATGQTMEAFGPPVDVPEDAPTVDRIVGLVGRDPAWKP
ncbi:MAG TPA: TIGR03086 family metal-binding protein [Stackebrandtia sp.]|jgi:uncharacterized protein (TIGR03086 family)|uniref:TIGR03086 family metal-binding protein n=1 Tax=Stackebrandtia sp. TaxID=2023065 RepID=UPI002D4E6405|nr:TIGR03086 family metal-binding protein [Stackebrandtia sp.]HZE41897.1 TIGR03086 family metal-binding protein [Stackebrandtia sp.]